MSLVFSNTTSKSGLIQLIERNLGMADAFISGNATRLAQFTGLLNLGMDRVWSIIFEVATQSNPDDTNHTDYPIQFFNLVSGQREYSFTTDEDGNLITDIVKVAIKDSSGIFHEIPSVDQQGRQNNNIDVDSFIDGRNATGTPVRYDRTATGIFLDPIPSYNSTQGAKIFIKREGSYFATSDPTKKPGFAPSFHEYPALYASYNHARANGLKAQETFKRDMLEMEQAIRTHYGLRDKDVSKRMIPNTHNTR